MLLSAFKTQGIKALVACSEEELNQFIRAANDAYYADKTPLLLTDNEYDIVCEYTKTRFPKNKVAAEGHTHSSLPEKNKVKLPYEMWSMDKIKPDTNALTKWQQTYNGPYVLSCKLDGVSGLYSTEGARPKLYTRGNGLIGQDISHFLPYLNLPLTKNITLRGEFIIKKEVFKSNYSNTFANARNLVAGIINQKTPDALKCADLDFVVYEVLKPILKPSAQLAYLKDMNVVAYKTYTTLSNERLSDLLLEWRAEYAYEIDGVICVNDAVYPRQTGNPAHAFAFKMVISEQVAEAKVVDVLWTASKDGYLKPRVQIEPVNLNGVRIEYATGFNAKFIVDHQLGVGALIRLMRSGDVIPHIIEVVQPAAQAQMPAVPYEWNSTRVDILLQNKATDPTVREKNITLFFSSLAVDGLGAGNVKKIIAAGFDTVPKIVAMTAADFLTVEGFQQKMSTKIKESIALQLKQATLADLMHATNLFGRGFGTKKIQLILTAVPTILTLPPAEGLARVTAVEGMSNKTAEQFVQQIPVFLAFLDEIKLQPHPLLMTETKPTPHHPLNGKQYVMTGFRDKILTDKLTALGAEQGSAVRKNTFVLLVKDSLEESSKMTEAKKLGIPIMSVADFLLKYKL